MKSGKKNDRAYEEAMQHSRSRWVDSAAGQLRFTEAELRAVDRYLGIDESDVVYCETTCFEYAKHVLSDSVGVKELWLIPPTYAMGDVTDDLLSQFEKRFKETIKGQDVLNEAAGVFKGLTTSVPRDRFKLLVTAKCETNQGVPDLTIPEYNKFWMRMRAADGASGAVLFLSDEDDGWRSLPVFKAELSSGSYDTYGFTQSLELSSGNVLLAVGDSADAFHMEDFTNPGDPWELEATEMDLVVCDGCLRPSVVRSCPRVKKSLTLDSLAVGIRRGTSLSERDLEVKELPSFSPENTYGFGELLYLTRSDSGLTPSTSEFYEYPGDYYYIDGGCFKGGVIRPKVLCDIPADQFRYVVDGGDGEVLLVSRSSKEIAVYKNIKRPTLIGNSVFVVRLDKRISIEYLACWMRGEYAKEWLRGGARLLSKNVLASLPVPVLDTDLMDWTVRYEQSIDEDIFDMTQRLRGLRARNRFNPLGAMQRLGNGGRNE